MPLTAHAVKKAAPGFPAQPSKTILNSEKIFLTAQIFTGTSSLFFLSCFFFVTLAFFQWFL